MILERGELARISIDVETGYVRGRVLSPGGDELQRTWTSSFAFAAPSPVLTVEAPSSGAYVVELSVPTWVSFTDAQMFQVHVSSQESAAVRAAKHEQLQRDPRVSWLRANAQRLRTLEPNDQDFGDLEFLREVLRDTRVIFLGEGDNGGGSDVLAKTRLVRFLHEHMGFDVIVFLTGMHSSTAAWRASQMDPNPREALQNAIPRLLSESAQGEALIEYLAVNARGPRPLELAGFDSQLTEKAAGTLLNELRDFLRQRAPNSALLDGMAQPSRVLAGVFDGRFARDRSTLPSIAEQARAVEALRAEATNLEGAAGERDSLFWAQVLRSTATQAHLTLDRLRGAGAEEYFSGFVRQLAHNLEWLVNSRYANRKVIVWAHTFHAMRSPDATRYGRSAGYTVGEGVWEALGSRSFAIGLTSFDGASRWITQPDDYYQSVIPNQHSGDSFETLMAAAGHNIALVNLRGARQRNEWLGGRFLANALYLVPEEAEWSRALDALLFIRTQEPRLPAK